MTLASRTCRRQGVFRFLPGVFVFGCCLLTLEHAEAVPSGNYSCLSEVGDTSCGLSSSLSIFAGSEVRLLLLVSLDSGTRCVDDCAPGTITASVDGEAASAISYIGTGGSYMLIWKQGILVYTGSLSLTVAISGTAVLGTPASITSVAGAVVAANTLVYSNPGGGGVVGTIITFSLRLRDGFGNNITQENAAPALTFSVILLAIERAGSVAGAVIAQESGVYLVSYSCTASGKYALRVLSSDMTLTALYDVELLPAEKDPEKFTVSALSSGAAGAPVNLVLQASY
jgi:hypothetical protein